MVITAQRTPTRISCDGTSVDVGLAGELEAGVSSYELSLLADGVSVATAAAGPSGGTLQAPLVDGRSYTVAARALGDGRSGPLGPAVAVITSAPSAGAIVTTGRSVEIEGVLCTLVR